LSCAIEAASRGASVLLLDKTAQGGGNSAKASSGINGAETLVQLEKGVVDTVGALQEDTARAGQHLGGAALVHKLAADSREAIRFLKEDIELPLTDVIQLGGHSAPRTHRLSTQAPIGFSLIKALKTKLQDIANVRTEYSAEVLDLLWEDKEGERTITGVSYRNAEGAVVTQLSDAVVVATGGMAFDHSKDGIFAEFAPELMGLATSSGPQADGAGIKLGRKAGAELIHMDQIQIHPTGLVDPKDTGATSKILGPEALRGTGGLLVLKNGKRFVNELARRGHVTQTIRSEGDNLDPLSSGREQKSAFIMLNAQAVEEFSAKMFGFYVGRGIFRKYDTAGEMCAAEGIVTRRAVQVYCAVLHYMLCWNGSEFIYCFFIFLIFVYFCVYRVILYLTTITLLYYYI
jgi:succinate dehydrogenase/fumarate reductase flavoprotein subunit